MLCARKSSLSEQSWKSSWEGPTQKRAKCRHTRRFSSLRTCYADLQRWGRHTRRECPRGPRQSSTSRLADHLVSPFPLISLKSAANGKGCCERRSRKLTEVTDSDNGVAHLATDHRWVQPHVLCGSAKMRKRSVSFSARHSLANPYLCAAL